MLFTTTTQFIALALCLIAGWIFGLASSSGGRKWRDRFHAEEAAHKHYRTEVAGDLQTREARLREVEAERDRFRGSAGAAVMPGAAAAGLAGSHATHAHSAHDSAHHGNGHGGGIGGWFGWNRDNLSRIRGIDDVTERALNDAGIKTFRAIESLSRDDAHTLEARVGIAQGTIERDGWREQAAMIREGRDDEHRGRWG